MVGDHARTFMSPIAARASSLIISFISVHSHKQIIVSVYEDRNVHQLKQKCGLQEFHRLALIIKMEHVLNMCIFFLLHTVTL